MKDELNSVAMERNSDPQSDLTEHESKDGKANRKKSPLKGFLNLKAKKEKIVEKIKEKCVFGIFRSFDEKMKNAFNQKYERNKKTKSIKSVLSKWKNTAGKALKAAGSFLVKLLFSPIVVFGLLLAFIIRAVTNPGVTLRTILRWVKKSVLFVWGLCVKMYRLIGKWLANGVLVHSFWIFRKDRIKTSYLRRIIYLVLPFVLISILGLIIVQQKAYVEVPGFYPFTEDYTNCFMLLYIFIFMYYVSGIFVYRYNEYTDGFINDLTGVENNKHRIVRKVFAIVSYLFVIGAPVFIVYAQQDGKEFYWYDKLSKGQLFYYGFLISMAWYMSARLFLTILINAISVFVHNESMCAKKEELEEGSPEEVKAIEDRIRTTDVRHILNCLSASMGFGAYFLIAVGMILYSDWRATKNYDRTFAAYEYRWTIILITVVLSVFYFGTIILCYRSIKKNDKGKDIENQGIESNNNNNTVVKKKNTRWRIDPTSFEYFLLSALFPGLAALVQLKIPLIDLIAFLKRI